MKVAASRSTRPVEYRAIAKRARKLRRTRVVGVATAVVLLLGVGAVSANMLTEKSPQLSPAEDPLPSPPEDEIGDGGNVENGESFVLTYPSGWHQAEESLTPDLLDPVELFSVATLPLEYRKTDCSNMPMGALESMGNEDAFVSVQERTPTGKERDKHYPPRPEDFSRNLEGARLACIPQDLEANFIPFSDQGRLFYALVAFGTDVTPETEAEAWAILNEVTFEPAESQENSSDRPGSDRCTTGIEGKGKEVSEHYPPRPYFEVFNLWGTPAPKGCLVVAAGRQRTHDSDGEDDPNRYVPEGMLMIFGDDRTKGRIDLVQTPLPGPVRIIGASRSGYRGVLLLQSLVDCREVLFSLRSLDFEEASASLSSSRCPRIEPE